MDAVTAADFWVRFQGLGPDVSRPYPFGDLSGVKPGIEHALARRIEAAGDDEREIGFSAGRGLCVFHGFFLLSCQRVRWRMMIRDVRRVCRDSRPRNGDRSRAIRRLSA